MSTTADPSIPIFQKIRFWSSFIAGLVGFGYLMVGGGYLWRGDFNVQLVGFVLALGFSLVWLIWRGVIWMDPFPRTGLELGIALGLLAVLVSLLASPDPRQGLSRAGWLAGYALIFYFLVNLLSTGLDRWGLLAGLVTVTGLVLAQAVAETFHWYQDWFQAAGLLTLPPAQYRFSGLLSSSVPLIGLANLFVPALLFSLVRVTRPAARLLAGAWLVVYALALPFSSSRGGWLGLAVSLGVGAAFWAAANRPWRAVRRWPRVRQITGGIVLLLAAAGVVWLMLQFMVVFASNPSHGGDPFGISGRETFWANALRIWQSSPWFGVGPGRFGLAYLAVQPGIPPGFWAVHAHNLFLQALAEFGLAGLAAWLLLLAVLITGACRCFRRSAPPNRPWTAALLAGLAGLLVQLCFDEFTTWAAVMAPAVCVLAWVWTTPAELPVFRRIKLVWLALPVCLLTGGMGWSLWAYQPITHWQAAAASGDWRQAAQWASESASRDSNFFFYQAEAGLLWAWQAEYQQDPAGLADARAALARSLALEPTPSWTWAGLAVLDFTAGDRPAALEHVSRAIAISPATPSYWLNRANMYEQSGNAALAEADYRKALELAPGWASHPFWQATPLRRTILSTIPTISAGETQTPAYLSARAAAAAGQTASAVRLLALAAAQAEPDLAIAVTRALLDPAAGFDDLAARLDGARFNLDPGLNFFYAAMVSNRATIAIQLVPGFLQLTPDFGQFDLLQSHVAAALARGDCPTARHLAGLKQQAAAGYALQLSPISFSCP